jgi:anti-sigma factor RsiW
MHAVIIEDLEEYLSGCLPPTALNRFQAHLDVCGHCRQEVDEMQQASSLFESLKADEAAAPPPSFVAQVMQGIEGRPRLSFWSPFGDFAFGRRVVFASLLTLAVLGTVLVSREQAYAPEPPTPEAVMAADTQSTTSDQMLGTLVTYEP